VGRRSRDPPREPRRNERDHNRHEVDAALVPNDVDVAATVDEGLLDAAGKALELPQAMALATPPSPTAAPAMKPARSPIPRRV